MRHLVRGCWALILCAVVVTGAAGCRKKPPAAAPAPPPPAAAPTTPPPPPAPTPPPPPPAPKPLTEEEEFARMSLDELNAKKPLADVYFDYDKSDIRDEARASLQKNSEWLKKWTSTKITVEGHCDARGSSEYNLALGERRAIAVRDYLVSLGIGADRLSSVSKGKEQPFCTEENESCWSQNRRGHFIITAK
jgi:peptidoglycan-associated lipoprotein